ncbi:hypothetical protein KDH_12550 [Dictyobacter sp. S3.2.2.5]|uniref:Uncharacterized protein n=1 Tax=Dictyobacter halimunensis TaxID=3026934 RepID=A0ABQ6FNL6_9CHLR|nr:hypothetical protein KDH_12550 [Dictyobacter sp. S3.2.2.5]
MTHSEQPIRLIPPLPQGPFINEPEKIERFMVRIAPDGKIMFKGTRESIEEFLRFCHEQGLLVHVDHISLCG